MPGPTSTKNPWAAELNKKSQRRRSHHFKGNDSDTPANQDDSLSETRGKTMDAEKADEVKKCVKVQDRTSPKVSNNSQQQQQKPTPSSSPESKSLYQDARSQLKPVANILRWLSEQLIRGLNGE